MDAPDFDQLALNIVGWLLDRHAIPVDVQSKAQEQGAVAAQLCHVWNARGAADIDAADDLVHFTQMTVAHAIRSLDVQGNRLGDLRSDELDDQIVYRKGYRKGPKVLRGFRGEI